MLLSDVAFILTDDPVPEPLQLPDKPVSGYAARELHAASTGINSSFT